jgi:ATP-dependent Clp protease ATP-binding subunit ClpX
MEILTKPKNALVKQYQRMFELDGFELDFDIDALQAIADQAVARETGARGLRAIMEEILGPIMFEIPGSDIQGVVKITRAVVDGAEPQIVPFKSIRQEKSA